MATNLPIATYSIDQNFYVEALSGGVDVQQYLNRFPEEVYTHAVDSHLYLLLYVLLGPAGVGWVRDQYLVERLKLEEANISGSDLDSLYSSPFLFARLAEETYDLDADTSLLPLADRQTILSYDSSFRNRAQEWLAAIRAGGTPLGIKLAASSGLAQPVDVVENYKYLYDQYADVPLGLVQYGQTNSLNEIVLVPRNDVPDATEQAFSFAGNPSEGFFSIIVPLGTPWQQTEMTVSEVNSVPQISVDNAQQYSTGNFITFLNINEWNQTTTYTSGTHVIGPDCQVYTATSALNNTNITPIGNTAYWTLANLSSGSVSGINPIYGEIGAMVGSDPVSFEIVQPTNWPAGLTWTGPTAGTYTTYVGQSQTGPIPYNANWAQVQAAIAQLITVDSPLNVICTGGPLPNAQIGIVFANALAGITINEISIETGINSNGNVIYDVITGVGVNSFFPHLGNDVDGEDVPADIYPLIETNTVGTGYDTMYQQFAPEDVQTMFYAVDVLQPQTAFVTTTVGQSKTQRQPTTNTFARTNYTEVLRFVTGDVNVPWPATDGQTNWVVPGQEIEAPTDSSLSSNYVNFHDVVSCIAYTEAALNDPNYQSPQNSSYSPWYTPYWDIHIGPYNQIQQRLFPLLAQSSMSTSYTAEPDYAIAAQSERPLITGALGDPIGIINNVYPTQYLGLPGVQQLNRKNGIFYGSTERSVGTDYLEIDLGSVQAVNFLYFEATNKPYSIEVAYDTMDQVINGTPQRNFYQATVSSQPNAPSTTSLSFSASSTWTTVLMYLGDNQGNMLYTRFIRLGFTRNAGAAPFVIATVPPQTIPYSIEIRNCRIGRNISSSGITGQNEVLTNINGPIASFAYTSITEAV